jgi:hypothetical protein
MTVPRGTLIIISVLLTVSILSYGAVDTRINSLSESVTKSEGLYFTKSLTSSRFGCIITLDFAKEIIIRINYCNSNEWLLTLKLKESPQQNLIMTAHDTIIYDSKEGKVYQSNTGNNIKFLIALVPQGGNYRFCHTIGFEKEQTIPDINIDLSSIIKASIERDRISFTNDKGVLIADGVHEQNNIKSRTKTWFDNSGLPIKIELSQKMATAANDTAWRRLALFENITTTCYINKITTKELVNYARLSKIEIKRLDRDEIMLEFLRIMKTLGVSD